MLIYQNEDNTTDAVYGFIMNSSNLAFLKLKCEELKIMLGYLIFINQKIVHTRVYTFGEISGIDLPVTVLYAYDDFHQKSTSPNRYFHLRIPPIIKVANIFN